MPFLRIHVELIAELKLQVSNPFLKPYFCLSMRIRNRFSKFKTYF